MLHRILSQGILDIKKEVLPSLTVDTVHMLSFLGVPMLTRPQELGIKALTVAVSAGCFKKKGACINIV